MMKDIIAKNSREKPKEMPISKWTKETIISQIKLYQIEYDGYDKITIDFISKFPVWFLKLAFLSYTCHFEGIPFYRVIYINISENPKEKEIFENLFEVLKYAKSINSKIFFDEKLKNIIKIQWGFQEDLTIEDLKRCVDYFDLSDISNCFSFADIVQAAFEKVDMKNASKEYKNLIENRNFNKKQKEIIKKGFIYGLSIKKIKFYARKEFNWQQMDQIQWGFYKGLSEEQIKIYINMKYTYKQMSAIRFALEDGLTLEQVKSYADPKFTKV